MENLELRLNNPYSIGSVFTFPEGDSRLFREPLQYVKSTRDRYFTSSDGDTLDSIAFQAYGDSKWYWVIWDINKLDASALFLLEPGTSLLVPDLEKIKTTNL